MHPARHEEMRRHLAALGIAERVRQRLGLHLHPGLRDVVGRIARRRGDALLRAGIDDDRRRPLRHHRRREGVHAIDHTPEVHAEHMLPALIVVERATARRRASIVHQHRHLAEPGIDGFLQRLDVLAPADVGDDREDLARAPRHRHDLLRRACERLRLQVGNDHLHSKAGKPLRRGEPDAARPAGDHGGAAWRDGGVVGHGGLLDHSKASCASAPSVAFGDSSPASQGSNQVAQAPPLRSGGRGPAKPVEGAGTPSPTPSPRPASADSPAPSPAADWSRGCGRQAPAPPPS